MTAQPHPLASAPQKSGELISEPRAQVLKVGDRVRIERDEARYPSKGSWPQFRGRAGTVTEVNRDRKRPHLTEYGVVFGATWIDSDGSLRGGSQTWFKRHELRPL